MILLNKPGKQTVITQKRSDLEWLEFQRQKDEMKKMKK